MPQNNQAFDIVMTQRWGRVFLELLSKSVIYNQAIHRNIFLDILNKPSKQIPRFTVHTQLVYRVKRLWPISTGVCAFSVNFQSISVSWFIKHLNLLKGERKLTGRVPFLNHCLITNSCAVCTSMQPIHLYTAFTVTHVGQLNTNKIQ